MQMAPSQLSIGLSQPTFGTHIQGRVILVADKPSRVDGSSITATSTLASFPSSILYSSPPSLQPQRVRCWLGLNGKVRSIDLLHIPAFSRQEMHTIKLNGYFFYLAIWKLSGECQTIKKKNLVLQWCNPPSLKCTLPHNNFHPSRAITLHMFLQLQSFPSGMPGSFPACQAPCT